jgi:hypothetical protein
MRLYSESDERHVRAQAEIRGWKDAGLISASQTETLLAENRVELKRTNVFLRAALALFTALVVAAVVFFVMEFLSLHGATAVTIVTGVAAVGCFFAAQMLIGMFGLYRFGVEEMLAACSVILLSIAVSQFWTSWESSVSVALVTSAAGGFAVYRRFGFVWAAFAGMCCAAAIPFQFGTLPLSAARVLSAAILGLVFLVVRPKRTRDGEEWPGDDYGVLQAAALMGVYLVLNLHLLSWWDYYRPIVRPAEVHGGFYWLTWVLTWILPAAGLVLGVRDKDRPLLMVSVAMAIVTLVTNKPYLGWERHTWDPMLLGVLLIAVAVVLRRWLSTGADGARYGFTAARIFREKDSVLTLLSAAPFPVKPHAHAPAPTPPSGFDGGRSGGAGGGAGF